jgi:hypothetical protein
LSGKLQIRVPLELGESSAGEGTRIGRIDRTDGPTVWCVSRGGAADAANILATIDIWVHIGLLTRLKGDGRDPIIHWQNARRRYVADSRERGDAAWRSQFGRV